MFEEGGRGGEREREGDRVLLLLAREKANSRSQ
jgi:hypothetical protein